MLLFIVGGKAQLKIYINYDTDEDAAVDDVVSALRAVMPDFELRKWKPSPNKRGEGFHEVYFVTDGRHYEH